MDQETSPIWLTFTRVLSRLDWVRNLKSEDFGTDQVEAKATICDYFKSMNLGVRYEQYVHSKENLANPNCLSRENFSKAKLLHSQGWSYDGVSGLIDCVWELLEEIPITANLFESDSYDDSIVDVLADLCGTSGIQPANATKLLYQKRPWLVPILDDYARKSLGIGWVEDNHEFFRYALGRVRDFERRNRESLTSLETWLAVNPRISAEIKLSRVRLIDICAWYQQAKTKYG